MKDRLESMLALLDAEDPGTALTQLCELALSEVEVDGSAISVLVAEEPVGVLASAGVGIPALEQLLLGREGPSTEAHRSGAVVRVPDLAATSSWPAFGEEAAGLGIAAVFALPLRVGAAAFGALVLGRQRIGEIAPVPWADAVVFADVAALLVAAAQARTAPADPLRELSALTDLRAVVHQATGMISVQLDLDMGAAHLMLRTRAWVLGRPVAAVARDVVTRQLRFSDDTT